jgi:hypothetical protein
MTMKKYTIWYCGLIVEEEDAVHALWKASKMIREGPALLADYVVNDEGIVEMASDTRDVGKKYEEVKDGSKR